MPVSCIFMTHSKSYLCSKPHPHVRTSLITSWIWFVKAKRGFEGVFKEQIWVTIDFKSSYVSLIVQVDANLDCKHILAIPQHLG